MVIHQNPVRVILDRDITAAQSKIAEDRVFNIIAERNWTVDEFVSITWKFLTNVDPDQSLAVDAAALVESMALVDGDMTKIQDTGEILDRVIIAAQSKIAEDRVRDIIAAKNWTVGDIVTIIQEFLVDFDPDQPLVVEYANFVENFASSNLS